MWKDPIVEEIHKFRETYAQEFDFDVDAIYRDIETKQEKSDQKHISFPARKPESVNDAA